MGHLINPALRQQKPEGIRPTFLYSTPDGFENREEGTTRRELVGQLLRADPLVKLFEDNRLVHTSEECGYDPNCPRCGDPKARHYVRLHLAVDDWVYQLDLPPNARQRFIALAEEIGDDEDVPVFIKLTTTRKESSRGLAWAHVEFSIVRKEAA